MEIVPGNAQAVFPRSRACETCPHTPQSKSTYPFLISAWHPHLCLTSSEGDRYEFT
jgi:hypothetical protein